MYISALPAHMSVLLVCLVPSRDQKTVLDSRHLELEHLLAAMWMLELIRRLKGSGVLGPDPRHPSAPFYYLTMLLTGLFCLPRGRLKVSQHTIFIYHSYLNVHFMCF